MIVTIVPFKGGSTAKSRLDGSMSSEQRSRLGQEMLDHVLSVARNQQSIQAIGIVSATTIPEVTMIPDPGTGLNDAIAAGMDWAIETGAEAAIIIPADLPFLTAADVEALISATSAPRGAVVAPSKDGGTGALALRPPNLIRPRFGLASADRHIEAIRAAGVEPEVMHRFGLAVDIDVPEDLDLLGDDLLNIVWGRDRMSTGVGINGSDQT